MTIDDGRYKEQTAQVMIDIITSPEQHPVMREYVLQYTTDYFERHWLDRRTMQEKSDFSAIDQQYQTALLTAMWTAVQDRDQSVAATALVRLHELSTRFSFVDRDKVTATTIRLIKDDTTPESSHMAALRVAAARRLSAVREEAENIVTNASYSVAVRMAAMHTAVTMEPGEKFIDSLVSDFIKNKDADKRLKKAATLLLKKLSNRKA